MEELKIAGYALPLLLSVLLGFVYKIVGDPIPDRWKSVIAVAAGVALGIGAMFHGGVAPTAKAVITYAVQGFMYGAGAIGIYEVTRSAKNPRT